MIKQLDELNALNEELQNEIEDARKKLLEENDVPQEFSISAQHYIVLEFIKLIPIPCPGTYRIEKFGFVRCQGKKCPTCNGSRKVTFQDLFSIMGQAHLENLTKEHLRVTMTRKDEEE